MSLVQNCPIWLESISVLVIQFGHSPTGSLSLILISFFRIDHSSFLWKLELGLSMCSKDKDLWCILIASNCDWVMTGDWDKIYSLYVHRWYSIVKNTVNLSLDSIPSSYLYICKHPVEYCRLKYQLYIFTDISISSQSQTQSEVIWNHIFVWKNKEIFSDMTSLWHNLE